MFTAKRSRPLSDQKASEETQRLFHEIKQTLRLTGIPSSLRSCASYESLFPAVWDAMRPNVETRAFEEAADRLREEAVQAANGMPRLSALGPAQLGESQAYQAENALLLHHYLAPKLLVFVSALAAALETGPAPTETRGGSAELIERGAPARMPPLELVEESLAEPGVRRTFADVKRVLGLEEISEDWRALALWPKYLVAAWQRLRPLVKSEGYKTTCRRLGELSREVSRSLPYPAALARGAEDFDEFLEQARRFERALPGMILNVSLLVLDWEAPELARRSPYPARPRPARGG